MNKKTYASPVIKVVEIRAAEIICTSGMQSQSTETYQDGSIEDWY